MNAYDVLSRMSTDDKIRLCSGLDQWHLTGFPELGIPSIMVADGPHGLRKQIEKDQIGLTDSVPSTCFPTASLSACSWDKALIYQMGQILATEAIDQKVSVILGPGANIKRNARCGRNFEYFSEDPLLSGQLAASFINGVQSLGVGASLKHFAANNQELQRMSSSSNIDIRALREIYLRPFEIAIKLSQPWTVMASYNKINGVHSSSNPWLLTTVLRNEWNFEGAVVSDWGAAHERDLDMKAGLDLEMPGNGYYYLSQVKDALASGTLKMEELNACALRLLKLIEKAYPALSEKAEFDPEEHHAFARKVAQESMVLLKNENHTLPLGLDEPILVLGEFAEKPRIQGSGSSKVHPYKTESLLDGLTGLGANFSYRRGYDLHDGDDLTHIQEAVEGIAPNQKAVIMVGLSETDEVEGFDRDDLKIARSHHALIEAVLEKTDQVIIILVGGAPYELPWAPRAAAILNGYLPGEAGGSALCDVIYGLVNPSGKLAETWPMNQGDAASDLLYGVMTKEVTYRESIFVGYRDYDSANKPVCFPFGHGLSYTTFDYKDLSFIENVVSFTLTNTGDRDGSEIIQVYVSNLSDACYFPSHELKAFEKITLKAKESKVIHLALNKSAFEYFDPSLQRFVCASGIYEIQVGASSRDLRLSTQISVKSPDPQHVESHWKSLWYGHLKGYPLDSDFEALTGMSVKTTKALKRGDFTLDASINDMNHTLIGKVMKVMSKQMLMKATDTKSTETSSIEFKVMMAMVMDMPIRNTMLMSQGQFPESMAYGILDIANGHWIKGLKRILNKAS